MLFSWHVSGLHKYLCVTFFTFTFYMKYHSSVYPLHQNFTYLILKLSVPILHHVKKEAEQVTSPRIRKFYPIRSESGAGEDTVRPDPIPICQWGRAPHEITLVSFLGVG